MTKNYAHVLKYRIEHPWARPREYARRRCLDKRHREYKRYGGAGIKFDLTMQEAKQLFIRDHGYLLLRPSLDRIDPKDDYTFSNCRFIELSENIARHGYPEQEEQIRNPEDVKWEE